LDDRQRFMHPVVRAVVLHFWLAYDHPFSDGNGRAARALFYWYMRVRGYRLIEYLSISRILREAPSQYGRSFVLTETDERDTTYFLIYQLQVIERATEELHRYLQRKAAQVRRMERLLKGHGDFNHRQIALLSDAVRHPSQTYTLGGHAGFHNVTHETARSDLGALADRGLLLRRRDGRSIPSPRPRIWPTG
jgi:Fic family protein